MAPTVADAAIPAGFLQAALEATRPLLVPAFTAWGSAVTWLEIGAFVLAIAMVLANIRVMVVGWPLAIASSLSYALLFADSRLYGEATLQLVFIAVAVWGWRQWARSAPAAGRSPRVTTLSGRGRATALLATLAAWPLVGALLARTTDTDVPYFDALPTVASITGQWLLGRKYVDNWPVWIAVNLVSMALFASKGLWLTVFLYGLFVVLAVAGWRQWRALATDPVL